MSIVTSVQLLKAGSSAPTHPRVKIVIHSPLGSGKQEDAWSPFAKIQKPPRGIFFLFWRRQEKPFNWGGPPMQLTNQASGGQIPQKGNERGSVPKKTSGKDNPCSVYNQSEKRPSYAKPCPLWWIRSYKYPFCHRLLFIISQLHYTSRQCHNGRFSGDICTDMKCRETPGISYAR